MEKTDLSAFASEKGIKYFLINYTDLFGVQRAKMVPAAAVAGAQKNGAGFAGFASWLDMSPADSDLIAMPDADSVIQVPWRPELAWVASDLMMDGVPVRQGPRDVLRALTEHAAGLDIQIKTGVEPEFFLLTPQGDAVSDPTDTNIKPCYDQDAILRRYDVIAEICDHLLTLGWEPYQNDHEDANGQFEINWKYDDALRTADKHAFFKFLVKSVAQNHGYKATFMPKPFANLTGNGCHVHLSGWSLKSNANLFLDQDDEDGLSGMAKQFLAGVLHHARAMSAFTNPTVNSYKRLAPGTTTSGATWAPNTVSWTGNNRTHMVRVPDAGRIEIRVADGAANPYLLQASMIAAGLSGIADKMTPPARSDFNMYTHKDSQIPALPSSLTEALSALEDDARFQTMIGDEMATAFLKLKHDEWAAYLQHYSVWERENCIDL